MHRVQSRNNTVRVLRTWWVLRGLRSNNRTVSGGMEGGIMAHRVRTEKQCAFAARGGRGECINAVYEWETFCLLRCWAIRARDV